ncbi:DUF1059 domain-containing protein [Nocardioides coralli]|uniref:DUF1059 domain-containing protein n=1 Tax=Nocardioides coralli TaxID=2872154 RepID=UPI001CA3FF75|nr:DUF1059 domain-containing protein [Nocardioides coralli]QZY27730.1 DUF1059 domain-containing protein [Nocardioides coralli]
MTYTLACNDVIPGCTARFENVDRQQMLREIAEHAATVHGITEVTPELLAELDAKMQRH